MTVFGILIPSLSCRAENVGSIQIEYHGRTQENEEVVFANANFSVFFVGKMEDGKWTLAGDFGNAGVSLEGIESSEKNEQAKQLYNYAVRQSIQGNALKTDENGIAMIGGLEQGLYLIAQTRCGPMRSRQLSGIAVSDQYSGRNRRQLYMGML